MILSPEHASQIAELSASRDILEAQANADRLARWQRRYPYDCVAVPAPTQPPKWPCVRVSIAEAPSNVTTIRRRRA